MTMVQTRRARHRACLVAVFVVALGLKALALGLALDDPLVRGTQGDEASYVAAAHEILNKGLVRDDAFYLSPLYSYLLAGLFAVAGDGITTVLVVQVVLGALNVVVMFLLAERVLQSRRAAVIAAILTLLFGPYAMYEWLVLKTTLAVLVTSVALLAMFTALERSSRALWMTSGVLFGALVLLRGNALLVLPFVFVGLAVEERRRRVTAGQLGLWLAGIALAILPATLHNAVAAHDLVPIAYSGGANFYIGNHRGATGTYQPLRAGGTDTDKERDDAISIAEATEGRPLWPSQVSRFWFRESFAYITGEPVAWSLLTLKKAWLFHNNAEIMDTVGFAVVRRLEPQLWLFPVPFGLVAALACCGLWFARRLPDFRLLVLTTVGSAMSVILFFVCARFRAPVVGLYILFAAAAIDGLLGMARSRRWRPLVGACAVVVIVFAASTVRAHGTDSQTTYNALGRAYAEQGDLESARRCFARTVAAHPRSVEPQHNLASTLFELGEYCQAATHFEAAARGYQQYAEARGDPYLGLRTFDELDSAVAAALKCGESGARLGELVGARRAWAHRLLAGARDGHWEVPPQAADRLRRIAEGAS